MAIKAMFFGTLAVAFCYALYFSYESSSKVRIAQERVEYMENECEAQIVQWKQELARKLEQERIKLSKAIEEKAAVEQQMQQQTKQLQQVIEEKDSLEKQIQILMSQLQQVNALKQTEEDLRKQLLEMQQAAEAANSQVKDLRAAIENDVKKHEQDLGQLKAQNAEETAKINEQLADMKRRYEEAVSNLAKLQAPTTTVSEVKHQRSKSSELQNNQAVASTPLAKGQAVVTTSTPASATKDSMEVVEADINASFTSSSATPAAKRSKKSKTVNKTTRKIETTLASGSANVANSSVTLDVKQKQSKKSKIRKMKQESVSEKQSNDSRNKTFNAIQAKSNVDSAKNRSERTNVTENRVEVTQLSTVAAEKLGHTINNNTAEPLAAQQELELQQPPPPIGTLIASSKHSFYKKIDQSQRSEIKDELNVKVDQNSNLDKVVLMNAEHPELTTADTLSDVNSDKRDRRTKKRRERGQSKLSTTSKTAN